MIYPQQGVISRLPLAPDTSVIHRITNLRISQDRRFLRSVDFLSSYLEKISKSAEGMRMISPQQIRGARAMLGMTQADLAGRANLSATSINNIERGTSDPRASNLAAIQRALEAAGIIFIAENGEGPGVRLKRIPFKHDVSHLHALWKREGGNTLMMVPDGITIEEVPDGLVCRGQDQELGRVSVVDGTMTILPALPRGSLNPDRLTHTELRSWAIEATRRLGKAKS